MGVDQGGLRREWYDLVTKFIFDPENQIFVPLEEGAMSVGPNPFPPPHIKGKHYRLAGKLVGKALYESAMGETYRLNLNARLAHSFLAQIIGVGVHSSMLEKDAPELWKSKIQFILENEVEFLDLTFTQEEVKSVGEVVTVELVPNGGKIPVTDNNKKAYIGALAKYMMESRVKPQVAAFLEGVYTLVPETLLTLWDEPELELLLCGVRDYNVAELRKHHTLVGRPMGRWLAGRQIEILVSGTPLCWDGSGRCFPTLAGRTSPGLPSSVLGALCCRQGASLGSSPSCRSVGCGGLYLCKSI